MRNNEQIRQAINAVLARTPGLAAQCAGLFVEVDDNTVKLNGQAANVEVKQRILELVKNELNASAGADYTLNDGITLDPNKSADAPEPRSETLLDETLDDSFPASDPPSQTPVTGAGAPDH